MQELTLDAIVDNIPVVTAWIDEKLKQLNCPMKAQMQIDIAIDEIFSNIAFYAYKPQIGSVTVRFELEENPKTVRITFIDKGIPYDPLAKEDPNTKLPLEEREEGCLGILILKKTMDEVSYEYKDGQNILTIKKNI